MTDLRLVDDAEMQPSVIFAEVDALFPGVVDFDWLTETEMPKPWLLGGESALRAHVRLLAGRSDVTAWTAEASTTLAAVLRAPTGLHRTLLGLDEGASDRPPTVEPEAIATPATVSAEGDADPSLR